MRPQTSPGPSRPRRGQPRRPDAEPACWLRRRARYPNGGGAFVVVAAENFWGDIASQIGGSHVTVTSIISDPNADPHTYETDPKGAAAISGASLVIENGAGYDDFVGKLLSTNPNPVRDLLTIATVVGAGGGNPNPHLWYDPGYVTSAARAIESRLAAHNTANAAAFADNLQTFLVSYHPYMDTVQAIKARYSGTPIAYTERVPGYLVARAGLRLATPRRSRSRSRTATTRAPPTSRPWTVPSRAGSSSCSSTTPRSPAR